MPKWTKGGRIDDPRIVVDFILAGDVIFEGDKPQNAGWLQNWSISQIRRATSMGHLFIAIPSTAIDNKETVR